MSDKNQSIIFWSGAILFVIAYMFWLDAPFYLDDFTSIFERPAIVSSSSINEFFHAIPGSRIIVDLSFYLNYSITGPSAAGFRIVNIALHITNAFLVFHVVRNLSNRESRQSVALLASLLFLLHPINTQAVTYIVQRYTELTTTFVLIGLLLLTKLNTTYGAKRIVIVVGWLTSLGLAFLSKQSGLILIPLSLVMLAFMFRHQLSVRTVIITAVCLVSVTLIAINIEPINSLTRETESITRLDYFLAQGPIIWSYWLKLAIPYGLHLESELTTNSFPVWLSIIAWLAHIALVIGAFKYLLKGSIISLGILVMYMGQSVESSFIPISDIYFEHRSYLSSIGYGIIIASLLSCLKSAKVQLAAVLGFLVLLAGLTYYRNYQWANPISFYKNEEIYSPTNHRVKNELARQLVMNGQHELAAERYTAIMNNPDVVKTESTLINAMVAYYNAGRADLTLQLVNRYISSIERFKPNTQARIYRLLGKVDYDNGNYRKAVSNLKQTLALFPKDRETLSTLAQAYVRLGQFDKAAVIIEKLQQRDDQYYRRARLLYCKESSLCQ